ncbi:MAG: PKD domain-containing protein [Flavobacteriales bacterium]|nr:PKD domain-containing protein [Flavobacteriales bacterium]
MKIIPLALALAITSAAFAQEPMERVFTMPSALELHGVAVDAEGHFVLASENEGNIQVTRISPTGDHDWTFKYPYFVEEGLYGNSIATGPDGIVVVGYAMGTGTNSRDGIILRIHLEGTLQSAQRMDAGGSNALHTLTATSDGFIAGGRTDAGGNQYDMQLTKLNTLGEVQWSRYYGTTGWDWGYKATELANGGFALVGYGDALGTGFAPSGYLVRTDALGNEMWARSISSGNGVDEAYCVAEASNGDLYVGGRSLGYFTGNVNAFLTKISATGQHIWTRVLEQGIEVVDIAPTPNGGVTWVADPQYLDEGEGGYEMLWGQFGSDGTMLWSNLYGAAGSDNPLTIVPMADGGYTILGFTDSYGTGAGDWQGILVRTDADGNADCHNIDLELQWTEQTAAVNAYTSLGGSTFIMYPWTLGQEAVAVGSYDPCCQVIAGFDLANAGSDYAWSFTNASTNADSYSWDFGDGATSIEQSPSHTYAANGHYTVCLTITGSCGSVLTTATNCQNVSIAVGITDLNTGADAPALFPSPASNAFTVKSATPIATIRLVDGQGRMVRIVQDMARLQMNVAVDDLPAGAYVAHVELTNGNTYPMRVMVAH